MTPSVSLVSIIAQPLSDSVMSTIRRSMISLFGVNLGPKMLVLAALSY